MTEDSIKQKHDNIIKSVARHLKKQLTKNFTDPPGVTSDVVISIVTNILIMVCSNCIYSINCNLNKENHKDNLILIKDLVKKITFDLENELKSIFEEEHDIKF